MTEQTDEARAREFMRTINDHRFEQAVEVLTKAFAAVRAGAVAKERALPQPQRCSSCNRQLFNYCSVCDGRKP